MSCVSLRRKWARFFVRWFTHRVLRHRQIKTRFNVQLDRMNKHGISLRTELYLRDRWAKIRSFVHRVDFIGVFYNDDKCYIIGHFVGLLESNRMQAMYRRNNRQRRHGLILCGKNLEKASFGNGKESACHETRSDSLKYCSYFRQRRTERPTTYTIESIVYDIAQFLIEKNAATCVVNIDGVQIEN